MWTTSVYVFFIWQLSSFHSYEKISGIIKTCKLLILNVSISVLLLKHEMNPSNFNQNYHVLFSVPVRSGPTHILKIQDLHETKWEKNEVGRKYSLTFQFFDCYPIFTCDRMAQVIVICLQSLEEFLDRCNGKMQPSKKKKKKIWTINSKEKYNKI